MGAQASQELERWASVSDLAFLSQKMRIIPTLPAECQVEALRYLWRSLHWIPAGEELLSPAVACDRLLVIVRGEVQAILGQSQYIPLLPGGSFLCEYALLGRGLRPAHGGTAVARSVSPLWAFRGWTKLSRPMLGLVEEYLVAPCNAARFHGRVRTTRPTLVGSLSRGEFLAALRKAEDPSTVPNFRELQAKRNQLWNVTAMGANVRELGAQDIAALRVVCEGRMNMSCTSVGPMLRQVPSSLFGSCCTSPAPGEEEEELEHIAEGL